MLVPMTTDTEVKTITLFAYGTLRTDEPLHSWVEDEIIKSLGVGVIRGARLFFSRQHKGYPYLVFTPNVDSDQAVGELFEVPLSEKIISMFRMEMNAGYTLTDALAMLPDGTEREVVVCSWQGVYGEAVPNNDWCSVEQKEWWV
jgi:gamma-glutamylcyclotransferase (GGCT)/AIG2-like uncharacterized protein YtfP